ncbi:hypothetical protein LFR94_002024 [Vibrio vulnificus]|nr:hypothetical protein [Vibrio vulnificus]KYN83026.1 hypothetical protein ATY36_12170 [Vibrio cidicii]EGQ7954337.1 hypothetical protein [Vibrio vulnificus]EGQ7988158.1 hypothetical protein [Vibrio vulnificus]EGQ9237862.1 hypothetical protein [Vibrio vulnificus]
MYLKRLEAIDVNFKHYEVGLERYVRCTWGLNMYRHHVFRANLPDTFVLEINRINESMGIAVESIDLKEYRDNFRSSKKLNKSIKENEYPRWIWFYGVEALKDTNFAGWLRSRLTVRSTENLRVIFVVESSDDYRDVFCDYRVPFYQSTTLLRTDIDDLN